MSWANAVIGGATAIAKAVSQKKKEEAKRSGSSSPGASGSGGTRSGTSGGGGGKGYTPLVQSDVDYDRENLSEKDYQAVQAAKKSYAYWQGVGGEAGQRGMDAAHQAAQRIREAAGYQALSDGSGYVPLAKEYEAAPAPTYEGSRWDDTMDRLADQLIGMDYTDWTRSDQYQALADRYGRQGRMSMQDVLGQVSSRTGGMASSYAGTVAQQQYNDWMTRLEETARQMYSDDRQDLAQNASLAGELAQRDYGRYQDERDRYEADRAFGYGAWSDWQDRVQQQVERQAEQERESRDDALSRALLAAEYGDYSLLEEMGIDTSDNQQDWERRMQEQQAQWSHEQDLWERGYRTSQAATDAAKADASSWSQMLALAKALAETGDYSLLEELYQGMKAG